MKKENIFYLIFLLTILTTRIGVFLFPRRKLIIDGTVIHHFWTGAIFLLVFLLLPKRYAKLKLVFSSVGSGLVADELTFIVSGGGSVSNYWSSYSIAGTAVLIFLIFALRKKLVKRI